MTAPDPVNLSALIDDARCFALVRQHRWPAGVRCPACDSAAVIRDGRDDTQPGGDLVPAARLAAPAPGRLAREAAALPRLLRVRAQRPAPRQGPPWRARRRLGGVT